MKFTTPCFVRVEDTEERKELTEWMTSICRKPMTAHNGYEDCIYLLAHHRPETMWMGLMGDLTKARFAKDFHDCGTDIALFKALAAMNDENDYMQMFVSDKGYFILYNSGETFSRNDLPYSFGDCWRKATAEEIIEHFNSIKS